LDTLEKEKLDLTA